MSHPTPHRGLRRWRLALLTAGALTAIHGACDGDSAPGVDQADTTPAPGPPVAGRVGQSATQNDNGTFLLAGGSTPGPESSEWWRVGTGATVSEATATYDPATNTVTEGAPMRVPRAFHAAVPLNASQTLILGGYSAAGDALADVELYNPPGLLDGEPDELQPLAKRRAGHSAHLIDLTARLVLVVGGDDEGTWELWRPLDGTLGARALPDGAPRRFHAAVALPAADGASVQAVYFFGGESTEETLATVLVYRHDAGTGDGEMSVVDALLPGGPRSALTATVVPYGQGSVVYVAGGFEDLARQRGSSAIDVFALGDQSFIDTVEFALGTPRGAHTATLLPGRSVLFAGGVGGEAQAAQASTDLIYEWVDAERGLLMIDVASSSDTEGVPTLSAARFDHVSVATDSGEAMLVSGASALDGAAMIPAAEHLSPRPPVE